MEFLIYVCVCWEQHLWFSCINPRRPFIFPWFHLSSIFVSFGFRFVFFFIPYLCFYFPRPQLSLHLCLSLLSFQHFFFLQMTLLHSLSSIYFFLLCLSLISNPGSLGSVDWLSSCSTPLCHPSWLAFIMDKGGLHTNTHTALSHRGPTPIPTAICHLSMASISISGRPPFQSFFPLSLFPLCYQFASIHLFPF